MSFVYWKKNYPTNLPEKGESLADYLIYVSDTTQNYLFATSSNPYDRISEWEKKNNIHGLKVLMIILMDNAQNFVKRYADTGNLDEFLTLHKKYIIDGYKSFGLPLVNFQSVETKTSKTETVSKVPTSKQTTSKVPTFTVKPSPKPKTLPEIGTKIYVLDSNEWKEGTISSSDSKIFNILVGDKTIRMPLRITYYRKDWHV